MPILFLYTVRNGTQPNIQMEERKMKRLSTAFLVLLLCVSLCACAGTQTSQPTATPKPAQTQTQAPSKTTAAAPAVTASAPPVDASASMTDFRAPDDANVNPLGTYPALKETVPLTIGTKDSTTVQDLNTNAFTQLLEEQINVDLTFDIYPAADVQQKVRILISSGAELPDVFACIGISDLDLLSYGSQGVLLALNDYYEAYGYYAQMMFEQAPEVKPMITSADGNLYAVPQYVTQTANEWAKRAWINQKWLDNLGLEMPSTTEEYHQVLKAFKTGDPNGNGKADEIPLVGSTNGWYQQIDVFFMCPFIYADGADFFTVENGDLDVAYTKDAWRAGLSWLSALCEEGLLSPLTFTQDQNQFNAMCRNEEIAIVGSIPAGGANVFLQPAGRISEYASLPPLTGPEGVCYAAFAPSTPLNSYVITSSCKNPAAAFIMGDYMLSEYASIWTRYGVPDVDWTPAQPGEQSLLPEMNFEAVLKPILVWGAIQNSYWDGPPQYRSYRVADGQVFDGNVAGAPYVNHQSIPNYYGKAADEFVYKLIYTQEEADELADLKTTINNYVDESTARFITGDLNVDGSDWEDFLAELSNMGLERYIQINQAAYTRMQG